MFEQFEQIPIKETEEKVDEKAILFKIKNIKDSLDVLYSRREGKEESFSLSLKREIAEKEKELAELRNKLEELRKAA